MWTSLNGILLKKIQYSDNKYILKIFTEDKGLNSFYFKSPHKKNTKKSRNVNILNLSMPIIEFLCTDNDNDINIIKEINISLVYENIPHSFVKQSITMFMNELILETIKLQQNDEEIYTFIKNSLIILDNSKESLANFPLWFTVKFAMKLGFAPSKPENTNNKLFDLISGKFVKVDKINSITLEENLSEYLLNMIETDEYYLTEISKLQRKKMMIFMLDFFSFHADFDPNLKTLKILNEVFL